MAVEAEDAVDEVLSMRDTREHVADILRFIARVVAGSGLLDAHHEEFAPFFTMLAGVYLMAEWWGG